MATIDGARALGLNHDRIENEVRVALGIPAIQGGEEEDGKAASATEKK